MESNTTEPRKPKKTKRILPSLKTVLVLLIVVLALGFGAYQYREAQRLKTTEGQQELSQAQIDELKNEVGDHIILPKDAEPVVATINNVDELKKTQDFYKLAKNGDKLLIYQKTKRAIIYRPSEDIIVNVGGLDISQTPAANQQKKEPQ